MQQKARIEGFYARDVEKEAICAISARMESAEGRGFQRTRAARLLELDLMNVIHYCLVGIIIIQCTDKEMSTLSIFKYPVIHT